MGRGRMLPAPIRRIPLNTKAGWGFMVLTNMLPSQGNGTYQFFMWAKDREGHTVLLGTRTMTCANASATQAVRRDRYAARRAASRPERGYVNFGWALTPLPKTIPTDGSTISVLVDGAVVGTADYNHVPVRTSPICSPASTTRPGAIGFRDARYDGADATARTQSCGW